jgi:hypothetical protein
MYKNTYAIHSPIDVDVELFGDGSLMTNSDVQDFEAVKIRPKMLTEGVTLDINIFNVFFSEKPLTVELLPPYLHPNDLTTKGFLISGTMDVGRWFRPVMAAFHASPGTSSLKIKKDEVLFYLKFKTTEKIIFKRIELTPELNSLTIGCTQSVMLKRRLPLETLYNYFENSGHKNRVLKAIKKQLT